MTFAAVLLSGCGQDSNTQTPDAPQATQAEPVATPLEKLKANALEETDYIGRVRNSFAVVQQELTKAEGKIPSLGKVSVFVDDNFVLLIKNEKDGDVFETKVNLKDLDPNDGGMMLIPDMKSGEFPGIKMFVQQGKPGVQYLKNGKLEREDNKLEIYLPTRPDIEKIAPALSQALLVTNKRI